MSVKLERLNNAFVEKISEILHDEVKEKEAKFATITEVRITNDLSYAKVYCTMLDDSKKDKCIHDLNGASGFIRSEVIKRKLEMRQIPEFTFVYDDSINYGNNIEKIIKNIHNE